MRSTPQYSNSLVLFSALCFLGLVAGCGTEEFTGGPPRIETYPVTGKVLVDGEAVKSPKLVNVRLVRTKSIEGLAADTEPSSWAGQDGVFEIGTYDVSDGAPAGEYKLTFEVGNMNMLRGQFEGGLLQHKYLDPAISKWPVTVTAADSGGIDVGTIELTSP
jgi:hypothetical protein